MSTEALAVEQPAEQFGALDWYTAISPDVPDPYYDDTTGPVPAAILPTATGQRVPYYRPGQRFLPPRADRAMLWAGLARTR